MVGKYPRKENKNLAYRGFMTITNTNLPLLEYLKSVIGGKITAHNEEFCYELKLSANEIRNWLPQILPFLIVKEEQAKVLLDFLDKQAKNAFAPVSEKLLMFYERSYSKLKELKKVRYQLSDQSFSMGYFDCAQCGNKFERTSRHPKKIYCSIKCKKVVHYTRSNKRIRLGIPAWNNGRTS